MLTIKEIIDWETCKTLLEIRGDFNWDKFKRLSSIRQRLDYAANHLEKIGEGSSRVVYILSSRFVLKLAKDYSKGLAQNKAELDVWTQTKTKDVVAAVYDSDSRFDWLVSEIVRPTNESEFRSIVGLDFDDDFAAVLELLDAQHITFEEYYEENVGTEFQPFLDKLRSNKTFMAAYELYRDHKVITADMANIDHWGKTADGRIVLLDYGYTDEVWNKHYRKEQEQVRKEKAKLAKAQRQKARAQAKEKKI